MTKSLALANAFLARFADDVGIQHMKLQKLCYYAYGWWLTADEGPLLDKGPEVWKYGPVFNDLYNDLSAFGNRPIQEPQTSFFQEEDAPVIEGESQRKLVDWIWRKYGRFSAIELSEMTHKPGTPWHQLAVRYNYKVPSHLLIPDQMMKDYFLSPEGQAEVG